MAGQGRILQYKEIEIIRKPEVRLISGFFLGAVVVWQDTMKKSATNEQLALSFNHTDNSLKQYLEECLNRPVSVVLTGNSTTMLSARMRDNVLRLRLHRMFLTADGRVVNEIVSYLKNRRGAMPYFRSFIRDNRAQLSLKPPKKITVRSVGKYFSLN